ncbi:MAG: hypothetical protein HN736_06140 [Anaerolineae bacterium]|jgi:uncharacterized protein YneF (UPF0154 family)|nr:hypothetical protein [Anaerolineae bacterium]MBT3714064.1 hypothetical protein [Anaerolineae bacterium]MBT4310294.1 hypothetical protein [Anaerolineae bacterium]MBT4459779.1 hypothetical protein [Anaerolineae bacterium]MBT4840952.1 hypothetical protein [Anaerolineae bacterium]
MINFAKFQRITTSRRTLKVLALALWMIGGIMLIRKASELVFEAYALASTSLWILFAIIFGVTLGGIKAKYIFRKACKKNLVRIDALEHPKLWQFYRPNFFLFLALMIATGATLSRLAHGNFSFLLGVAILDLSIATALLGSSLVFWQEKAFVE